MTITQDQDLAAGLQSLQISVSTKGSDDIPASSLKSPKGSDMPNKDNSKSPASMGTSGFESSSSPVQPMLTTTESSSGASPSQARSSTADTAEDMISKSDAPSPVGKVGTVATPSRLVDNSEEVAKSQLDANAATFKPAPFNLNPDAAEFVPDFGPRDTNGDRRPSPRRNGYHRPFYPPVYGFHPSYLYPQWQAGGYPRRPDQGPNCRRCAIGPNNWNSPPWDGPHCDRFCLDYNPHANLRCFHCGGIGHMARACPHQHKPSLCFACGEPGHFYRDCPHRHREYGNRYGVNGPPIGDGAY